MRSESDTIIDDAFGIPHESQHTVGEILGWFDKKELKYMGAFGPVTLNDTLFALRQPEFKRFQDSLEAFPLSYYTGKVLRKFAGKTDKRSFGQEKVFKKPFLFSRCVIQMCWFILGFRFSIFSLSGRKSF